MKTKKENLLTGRRNVLKTLGLGSAALLSGGFSNMPSEQVQQQEKLNKPPAGLPPLKIKSVKAIGVKSGAEGRGSNLVVLKVETSEPDYTGWDATLRREQKR
jgi:mannonate dehydratase